MKRMLIKQQAEGDFFKFYPRQKIKLDYIVILIYNNITNTVCSTIRGG